MGAAFLIQRWYTCSLMTPKPLLLFSQVLETLHYIVASTAKVIVELDILCI